MERPIFKAVGTKLNEIDTPALVVDLDAFESNVKIVHSYFINKKRLKVSSILVLDLVLSLQIQ